MGFVIVTHPFHPLNGQRLEVLYAKRRGADTVFVCAGGFSGQLTLPESWTARGEQAQAVLAEISAINAELLARRELR